MGTRVKLRFKFRSDVRLPWSADGKAPREFALFYFGANESTKGTVYLTPDSAKECMAAWVDYGNDLSGDYEHAITEIQAKGAPASCWFKLALKSDGLYAVDVKWTDNARRMIEAKEYRYYSPYFSIEYRDDKPVVVEIINVALTNNPATKKQRPLVSAWSRGKRSFTMFDSAMVEKLKALAVEKGCDESMAADLVLGLLTLLESSEAPEAPEAPAGEMPLACAPEEKMPMGDMPQDPMAMSKVIASLQAQMAEQGKELKALKALEQSRAKASKEALFNRFKSEGRLRFTTDQDARAILDAGGESLFQMAFGKVEPLVAQPAPKSPVLKTTAQLTNKKPEVEGFIAPVISEDEVKSFMAQPGNEKLNYRQALMALSRNKKG